MLTCYPRWKAEWSMLEERWPKFKFRHLWYCRSIVPKCLKTNRMNSKIAGTNGFFEHETSCGAGAADVSFFSRHLETVVFCSRDQLLFFVSKFIPQNVKPSGLQLFETGHAELVEVKDPSAWCERCNVVRPRPCAWWRLWTNRNLACQMNLGFEWILNHSQLKIGRWMCPKFAGAVPGVLVAILNMSWHQCHQCSPNGCWSWFMELRWGSMIGRIVWWKPGSSCYPRLTPHHAIHSKCAP